MNHSDLASAALLKLHDAPHLPVEASDEEASLAGASFIDQEPDLLKEAGMNARQASAWAASGHPTAE